MITYSSSDNTQSGEYDGPTTSFNVVIYEKLEENFVIPPPTTTLKLYAQPDSHSDDEAFHSIFYAFKQP